MNTIPRSLSRREALQRILGAAALLPLLELPAFGLEKIIGTDPNLHLHDVPWERVLTPDEMKIVVILGDLIIPADEKSPAASTVGVPDFINEWVSAPYPEQVHDLKELRGGFAWLDTEAQKRFQKKFAELAPEQLTAIADDICSGAKAKPENKKAASFFSKFRNLVAGGFYTTPEGWADLGYIGNKPLTEFPGPPPEVLKHLGLA